MKKENVFISWSGTRSKTIAEAFFHWLPEVIQDAKPWMSNWSIEKGSRGLPEIAKVLEGMRLGISVLTPENLKEPWILYEAGCLTKTVDEKTHLCTYLLGGLQPKDIEPPLGQFQHTLPEKNDTLKLIRTINKAVRQDDPMPEKTLDKVLERSWPDLEKELKNLPHAASGESTPKRSVEDMLEEILQFTRTETNARSTKPLVLSEPVFGTSLRSLGVRPRIET